MGKTLEVQLEGLPVRAPGKPGLELGRVVRGKGRVARLPGKVDDGLRPEAAVEVVGRGRTTLDTLELDPR